MGGRRWLGGLLGGVVDRARGRLKLDGNEIKVGRGQWRLSKVCMLLIRYEPI